MVWLGVTGVAGAQAGQTPARASDDQYYRFEADDLMGETFGTPPPLLRVRPKGRRVMFMRPRASFVVEMLESVDTL
jgi:hypothetical protein